MTSPAKRPAVTYQRGGGARKMSNISTDIPSVSTVLNPDAALQQKINDLLSSKENNVMPGYAGIEEEFDSAYHEASGNNAKKVHDLVQVGETRRFVDEIEYLLEGLQTVGPKSLQTVRSSLQEIVGKCFKKGSNEVDLAFGMKLKSHGALGTIFESLNQVEDATVFDNLLVLVAGLLYDVRRLDFFFKPQLAIKLAKHCILKESSSVDLDSAVVEKLKGTLVFTNLEGILTEWNGRELFEYLGIWILFKWSFSSITTSGGDCSSFFDLLSKETELLTATIKVVADSSAKRENREKSASLLDCLLNRKNFDLKALSDHLTNLLQSIISISTTSVTTMKLAVSLSGSDIGKNLVGQVGVDEFFSVIQDLMKIMFAGKRGETDVEILALSSFINLIDRCDDSVMDEFRYQKFEDCSSEASSILQFLTTEYTSNCSNESSQKSLLALALGFICRQNQTNVQVMLKAAADDDKKELLRRDIYSVASKFLLQQEQQQQAKEAGSDDCLISDRLKDIILTFKPQ